MVSISFYGMLAAGVYCAIQFGLPKYRDWRISGALADTKREAGRFVAGTGDPREELVLEDLRRRIVDIGVDEPSLNIYFGLNGDTLHVDYTIVIKHPIGDPTTWHFRHAETIEPVNR